MLTGPIEVAMGGVNSEDVGPSVRKLNWSFLQALQALLKTREFTSPIRVIVFHPIVLDPAMGTVPDGAKYERRGPAVQVNVNIPYRVWLDASDAERLRLYANALILAVRQMIKSSMLNDGDKDTLTSAIEAARDAIDRQPPNAPAS
jgi:hypothetical protein